MAHKFLASAFLVGTRVLTRAFTEAWQQASQTSQYAAAGAASRAGSSQDPGISRQHAGLTLSEACQILNVKPPQNGKVDAELVMERFKKLYDKNEVENGGSFYLQSKVLRARERIEAEVREAAEKAEREEELRKGWKPRMYR